MVRRSPAAQTTSVGPYTLAKPSVAVGRGSTPRLSASELDRAGVLGRGVALWGGWLVGLLGII